MDDMDQGSIKLGGEPSFFTGNLKKYSWTKLLDSKLGNHEKIELYSEALDAFAEAKQLPELFRSIFKDAFLPYRSPETLGLFLKEINHFDYTHPEELGNAYEYLLSIMSAQGDAGQFRTPRHIIDFIVEVLDPKKDESVLDPACGTGGFLVSTYNHILKQHDGKDDPKSKEKPLTPDERKKLMNNLEGYDIDPTMTRIAQVNMYLHQFKNPKIFQYDSLTGEDRWRDKFDVIMANPPFMSPRGGIRPHSKFSIQSNRSEVLFVDYIATHLKPEGRAGIIVPEGIIFQSGKAYKQLRKMLIEGGLYAVVSLPAGVFNPYSGVKTSILFINNKIANRKDEILFLKILNDGFDPGATKRHIEKNDLPIASASLTNWILGNETDVGTAIKVKKSEISATTDFNLNGERYQRANLSVSSKWQLVRLDAVAEVISGQSPEGKFYNEIGSGTPFYQGKTEFTDKWLGKPEKWTTSVTKMAHTGDILMSVRAPVGPVNIAPFDLCIGRGLAAIRAHSINRDFLFYVLKGKETSITGNGGSVFDSINRSQIQEIEIPLPPLEFQEQIVAELDSYAAIIEGAKKIVENWKPRIDIDPEWPQVPLGKICELVNGRAYAQHELLDKGKYPVLRVGNFFSNSNWYYSDLELEDGKYCEPGDLLYAWSASFGARIWSGPKAIFHYHIWKILNNEEYVDRKFLKYMLDNQTESFKKQGGRGGTMMHLTKSGMEQMLISLPPLQEQLQIVARLEDEERAKEESVKLADIFTERTRKVVDSLWLT
jgi:type I restriction enzyme M protein